MQKHTEKAVRHLQKLGYSSPPGLATGGRHKGKSGTHINIIMPQGGGGAPIAPRPPVPIGPPRVPVPAAAMPAGGAGPGLPVRPPGMGMPGGAMAPRPPMKRGGRARGKK